MGRTTRTITLSLPQEMVDKIEELMKAEHRTRSELLREALRRYVEEYEWRKQFRHAEMNARAKGLTKEQVDSLIDTLKATETRKASSVSDTDSFLALSRRKGKRGRP
jgi:CopG family transcriptional regulator/antitoxin EndoAI